MTAAPFTEEKSGSTGRAHLIHLVCCDENRALCGEDLRDGHWIERDAECAVCIDLNEADVRCGKPFCRLRQRLRGER